MPGLHDHPQEPLERVSKLPYVADGPKELWDVCIPPGVVVKRCEGVDIPGPMDCDDYARYLANSIESQSNPRLFSVLCIDKRDLKWGIIPKFPGHMVCLWTKNIYTNHDSNGGLIYHIGNWNKRGKNKTPHPAEHFHSRNLFDMANSLVASMTAGEGEVLAWIIMDRDLKVCKWGLSASEELKDIDSIELISVMPKSFIG